MNEINSFVQRGFPAIFLLLNVILSMFMFVVFCFRRTLAITMQLALVRITLTVPILLAVMRMTTVVYLVHL